MRLENKLPSSGRITCCLLEYLEIVYEPSFVVEAASIILFYCVMPSLFLFLLRFGDQVACTLIYFVVPLRPKSGLEIVYA